MRVLLVNKFYFPQGGADKHVLQLEEMLRARGHEVAVFAMAHPDNRPSPWAKYFVSFVDFHRVRFDWAGLRAVGRTLHSFEAARKMEALIKDFRPDVVHLHNIYHQISPSILPVIARHRIPIVQTLHDYALVSANYNLYAHGGICLHGRFGRVWEYIRYRCIKNSLAASLLAAVDQWWHDRMRWTEKYVATFISPSHFLADLVHDWRGANLQIIVQPNFIDTLPARVWPKNGRVLFLGRLSAEKGLPTLLAALAGSSWALDVVGTGPDEAAYRQQATELSLNVQWHGFQSGQALDQLISQAAVLVVPSTWYENCPLVILEAMARGTPVIATRMGGMPELVGDGQTGILYPAGDAGALRQALNRVLTDSALAAGLSERAVQAATAYTPGGYLDSLEKIYAAARSR